MTDAATATAPDPRREGPPGSTRAFVDEKVTHIQNGYVRYPQSAESRAALAKLRRGVGREPGTVAEVLPLTVNPDARSDQDGPTADERAIHAALTLYAVHQQSQDRRMHVPGTPFGAALGRIRFRDGEENPGVVRRFQALGTAGGFTESMAHARALITLLRGVGVGFDYGRFATDLVQLQDPARAAGVRLRWGRDFYRTRPPAADGAATPTAATSEEL
jgi:CRISPR system Cascade subunit CasB